jgi:teichuronic acid biosynthesis glycosyltransferase TuaC
LPKHAHRSTPYSCHPMKVLIVCSGNFPDPEKTFSINQAFINDQMTAINKYHNVGFDIYLIKGKGFFGYLSNIGKLRRKIKHGNYDLVHAHFCLSGLITLLASCIPVVITFHGSDINEWYMNILSSFTALWADQVIFVSDKMSRKVFIKTSAKSIIPCGVDTDLFIPKPQEEAKKAELLDHGLKYILFSSSFNIKVKNPALAKRAVKTLGDKVILVEMKNRTRDQVGSIINACDVLLVTSFSEGSPLVIKEAMACNCTIVSTNVGDVEWVLGDTEGCYIAVFDAKDVAKKLKLAIEFREEHQYTNGRNRITELGLDSETIAGRIMEVYKKVIGNQ